MDRNGRDSEIDNWQCDIERALDGAEKAGRQVEPIILLEYSRHPESFRKALLEGLDLKSCRDALALAGHSTLQEGHHSWPDS